MTATCIYMDNAATTPVDPRVAAVMVECLTADGCFANPSSTGHAPGNAARARVEKARAQVAALIGTEPAAIVWTSGATESNNLAILGVARAQRERGRHLVTARTEHKAVLDPCKQLEKEGFEVTYLKPGADGIVQPDAVAAALRKDTLLVSLMQANNEIGVIQDVGAVGKICRDRGVLLHVDAAQSAGKVRIDVNEQCVDLMSLTAHKAYGPKGIGALYVRRQPRPLMQPLIFGGGQEWGLRSGTLPTHQIVGMGMAYEIAGREHASESERLSALRQRLWAGLKQLGDVELNGHPTQRVAGLLNVSFAGVEGESLLYALPLLAVSTGSACTSASHEASYVLRALGRSDQLAQSSLRFSLGRFSTEAEVDYAIGAVTEAVRRLRRLAPASVPG
jgi:cysteine desulfurase